MNENRSIYLIPSMMMMSTKEVGPARVTRNIFFFLPSFPAGSLLRRRGVEL